MHVMHEEDCSLGTLLLGESGGLTLADARLTVPGGAFLFTNDGS
jgi:hypothetical protein